jgi:ribosomal protein S18 acetylase RimI-like enzyme
VIRQATAEDMPVLTGLWRAFQEEVPPPDYVPTDESQELGQVEQIVRDEVALLAERDGAAVGLVLARMRGPRWGYVTDLYVVPDARRQGIARELVAEAARLLRERGAEAIELEVQASNTRARAVYETWGFQPALVTLTARADSLVERLSSREKGPTFGSVHVQTDDAGAVERAAQKVMPRLGRTEGTSVTGPRNGWVAVHDELVDREPKLLARLAKELSYTLGGVVLSIGVEDGAVVHYTLFDRGGIVDEYVSVPEYHGELPPGDVIALGANPTVVSRLTGADPARVKEVARTAASPTGLPPATELVEAIAQTMGVAEAGHGWEG